jgi:hypothetical protein
LLKNYDEGANLFGYPQHYKGLELHPIKIKDRKYQELFYQIFSHPKNYIPKKEILKASYLKFLIYVIQYNVRPDGNEIIIGLVDILKYITKEDKITIKYKSVEGEGLNSVVLKIEIGDVEISEEDFEDIREIVLEQNGLSIEYVESYDPGLEESLIFENRDNGGITFQDEVFTFCALMHKTLKEIEDYTMLQFKIQMEKLIVMKEYDIYKPLISSGQITLKGGELKHYLYRSGKKGRYDSILIKKDEFLQGDMSKISKQ